ncbi:hypothetical protein E4U26_000772 [Claviceps purpurea]|nr:hypothetical protein E4U26_000772 [Claviceps purpurea]
MAPEEPVNLRAFVEAVPGLMTSHFESVLASQRRSITTRRESIGLYIGTPKYLELLEEEGTTESDWTTTISCKFWVTRECIDEWDPFSDMLVSTILMQGQPSWSLSKSSDK